MSRRRVLVLIVLVCGVVVMHGVDVHVASHWFPASVRPAAATAPVAGSAEVMADGPMASHSGAATVAAGACLAVLALVLADARVRRSTYVEHATTRIDSLRRSPERPPP